MGFTTLINMLEVAETKTPPALKYTRYYYPLILFLFFVISLTAWGIATSQASAPKPPPVEAVLNGDIDAVKRRRRRELAEKNTWFKRFAARFPGGVTAAREADEKRLSPLRKAIFNWLLVGVMITLLGNAVNVIMHALAKRGWWCGKDYVVRLKFPHSQELLASSSKSSSSWCGRTS